MKIYEKRTVENTVCVDTKCDKCGESIKVELYNGFMFSFSVHIGSSFPEGSYGDKYELDLCENCSKTFLEDIKKMGYNVQESEYDY